MKQPIEPRDIRKGDLVRAGFGTVSTTRVTALEYRAERDGDRYSDDAVAWQLLDRPEPAVELPLSPSLGWADGRLGFWNGWMGRLNGRYASGEAVMEPPPAEIVLATAVPTEALDALRVAQQEADLASHSQANMIRAGAINTFLNASAEANA